MPHGRIAGTGFAVPDRVVTNDDLAKMIDTSDEWIRQRTGIEQRTGRWRETGPASRRSPASGRSPWPITATSMPSSRHVVSWTTLSRNGYSSAPLGEYHPGARHPQAQRFIYSPSVADA
jgi:hypothetical protein